MNLSSQSLGVLGGGWLVLAILSLSYSRPSCRYVQSEGQSISTSRFVPQQTAQICTPLAGHCRLALRFPQRGHFMKTHLGERQTVRKSGSEPSSIGSGENFS